MELRIVQGIQQRMVRRIPKRIDPKMVKIREVSNFQKRNFITTAGASEFCTAKMAILRTIKKSIHRKICMYLPSSYLKRALKNDFLLSD
jgi:hypothetical protein